jgi:putative sterol carrier protein
MHVLIRTIEDYCRKKDVDAIVLVAPTQPGTEEVLKDWLRFDTGVMMAKQLSLPSLIRALLSAKKIRSSYAGKQVAFHIGDEILNARITLERVYVSGSNDKSGKATLIRMSSHTFLRIVLGQLNPYTAFVTRRIRIREPRNIVPMLKLLYMMRIAQPIYTSLADRL